MMSIFKKAVFLIPFVLVSCNVSSHSKGISDEVLTESIVGKWVAYDVPPINSGDVRVLTDDSKSEFRDNFTETGTATMRYEGEGYPKELGAFDMEIDSVWKIESNILTQNPTRANVTNRSNNKMAIEMAEIMEQQSSGIAEVKSEILLLNEERLTLKILGTGMILKYRREEN